MINTNHYAFFDFETGGIDVNSTEPVEIAVKLYNAYTLEPFPDGEFSSLCRPEKMELVSEEALAVNKIKREDIEKAPPIKLVWQELVEFVSRFNSKKNDWCSPIPAGYNIVDFDLPILRRMNAAHGPKGDKTVLFNTYKRFDLRDTLFLWFENSKQPENFKLDTLRDYFGISKNDSHRALKDVIDTAEISIRFLKLHRRLVTSGKIGFQQKKPKEKPKEKENET